LPITATPSTRSFTSSTPTKASTVAQKRRHRDPYAIAQAKARKAANLSRQEVLKKERAAVLGDPVRGITTPYLESFDTAIPPPPSQRPASTRNRISEPTDQESSASQDDDHLNFFLSPSELLESVTHSKWLTSPPPTTVSPQQRAYDEVGESRQVEESPYEEKVAQHQTASSNAAEALRRIASLSLGSSKDRLRLNKQRCIEDFGRHNTDSTLDPKPASIVPKSHNVLEKTPRVGPDTGSSEVQIAILTAKIRTLATFLEGRGRMDKVNKRNLRLLVHRRQKLLRYLERKERGGPRFRNVVEALGLTEGTWKGEISL
jgi:ribosomal protein S15